MGMLELYTRNWWAVVLRGIVAVVFGVLALAWPGITLSTLVVLFGVFAFMDGIFALVAAIGGWSKLEDHWFLLLEGALGILIGIMAYRAPGLTAVMLVLYIAAWTLLMGVLKVVAAVRLRKEIQGEWWLGLSGVLSLVVALALMSYPLAGALAMAWLIGAYATVMGVSQVILGFRLHSLHGRVAAHAA
jgi:uncharacterized membrane protein HdeD (DUF308 family)